MRIAPRSMTTAFALATLLALAGLAEAQKPVTFGTNPPGTVFHVIASGLFPRNRSIAEAIRNTVEGFKEGRQMQTTIGPGQTMFGDDVGTIVNTVTPIVASILQSRAQAQPGLGGYSHFGGQFQPFPGAAYLAPWPYAGLQPPWAYRQPQFQFGPAHGGDGFGQGGFGQGPWWGQSPGGSLPPHELAQVVSIVTPVVASIPQTRAYQMPLGYGLPRAA